jgi:hypothetical protein
MRDGDAAAARLDFPSEVAAFFAKRRQSFQDAAEFLAQPVALRL